ncbi:MAG: CvpA family protein [Desulfuromonadaceae bacterium]|nr:CvpA family protein [Desulfuromonadaceae bacterium]
MNYLDIAILVILGLFLLKGAWRGLLREICSLAGLLLGAFLALSFHEPLGQILTESFRLPPTLANIASFLLLFLITVIFFGVLGFLLSKFVKLIFLGGLNRVAGAVFGLGEGALLIAIVLFVATMGETPRFLQPLVKDSQLAPPFIELGQQAFDTSRRIFAEKEGMKPQPDQVQKK